jgi:L-fucose isomerase-like protein
MIAMKPRFALFFGNRGLFPASLLMSAREDMARVLGDMGHETLMLDAQVTRHGAVETPAEGAIYARFLKAHEGKYDGVVVCLPNFGDENGTVAALKNAGVPILIQAYPDDLDKMSLAQRRDAFCGKFSIMDVFHQNGIKFTALKPHTVAPTSQTFAQNIDVFDRVCRTVNGMRNMAVGAVGARTTAFKTVRYDELALQRHGITVEAFDLSDIFARMKTVDETSSAFQEKSTKLKAYSDFSGVSVDAFCKIVQLGVVLDLLVEEYGLSAIGLRCWMEMQQQLGISGCVLLSEMNDRFIAGSCEVDVCNAVVMHALSLASGCAAACLDLNNNYGDDEDKCILFHCGPVPQSMMAKKGRVVGHAIIENSIGPECLYGCNVGRIKATPFTFSSMMTESGKLKFYAGDGEFTQDPIPQEFFGCAGVAAIPRLQDVLLYIGKHGHRHHVSVTPGHVIEPLQEALVNYLGYELSFPQG